MATVLLFHSVLGIRQGERDAADRLRGVGHDVVLPDLLDGKVFDTYEPAMAHAHELGDALYEKGVAAAAELPDGFIVAGFSMGSGVATQVATMRAVSGVLQFSGVNIVEWFGPQARWPAGVDSQSHQKVDDPFRDPIEQQALADVSAAGGTLELFDYPGTGHLFTDSTLPDEYDAEATELMWSRVLPFVAARG